MRCPQAGLKKGKKIDIQYNFNPIIKYWKKDRDVG